MPSAMPLKAIRSKADLAINGAPPAFEPPLHVVRRHIGNREAFLSRIGQVLENQWLTSWTFIATTHALYWRRITPVFADIDPSNHNLPPGSVLRMIKAGYQRHPRGAP